MDAGRELDALVAEKVMGMKPENLCDKSTGLLLVSEHWGPPFYSTDIEAAWQVVEALKAEPHNFIIIALQWQNQFGWQCCMRGMDEIIFPDNWPTAETAPLAICLAALKAVGAEVPS